MNRKIYILSLLSLLLSSCGSYSVYSVRSRPTTAIAGGLLYALPKTQVRVAVSFCKMDYSQAPYATYAHDFLGIDNPSPDSVFSIRSIQISAVNQADPNAYYFVDPGKIAVNIDPRGLLMGIGLPASRLSDKSENSDKGWDSSELSLTQSMPEYNLYDRTDTFYVRTDRPGTPSLLSAKKDVRSVRQRAQAAAEQLEEIREKEHELLFGEYEGINSAEAMRFLSQQLQQEKAIILQQFTGVPHTETKIFWIDPKDEKTLIDNQTVELFRFSPILGLVDSTIDEAMVVYCNIRCENHLRNASRFIRYRTKTVNENNWADRRTFKYRVPETATITLFGKGLSENDPIAFLFDTQIKIAQFGSIMNLPKGNFQAQFDPATGELIYFSNR